MSVESLMTKTLTIQSPPTADDGMGGAGGDFSGSTTTRGAIMPASATEVAQWGQLGEIITHKIYLPHGTSVVKSQQLVYSSRNFNIRGVITPGEMTPAETVCAHVKVFAEEIT